MLIIVFFFCVTRLYKFVTSNNHYFFIPVRCIHQPHQQRLTVHTKKVTVVVLLSMLYYKCYNNFVNIAVCEKYYSRIVLVMLSYEIVYYCKLF